MSSVDEIINYYREEAGFKELLSEPFQQKIIQKWLDQLSRVDDINNWTALDFGSGVGCNLKTLQGFVNEIIAVDVNQKALDFAKKKYGSRKISYVLLDSKKLPFQNETFDLVVATEVFEHIPKPQKIVVEISRVLKSQGYLIVSTPNYCNLTGIIKKIKDRSNPHPMWGPWGGHEGGLERFTTWLNMQKLLSGFKIIATRGADYQKSWFYNNPFFPVRLSKYILMWPGKIPLIKKLGMNYFILSKKK